MMPDDITKTLLTPAQSRAARALLGWSQTELARRASVATSTVADFERGQRSPVTNNLEALKLAFEKEQITFPPGGAVVGTLPKIVARSRVPQDRVAPIRWITESHLNQWGSSRVGQDTFPELIRRLVLAESGYHPELRFPSGDSVAMQGWDGETNVEVDSSIIPRGRAGWELGTDKQPKVKADHDYEARTKKPQHLVPAETTFGFMRHCGVGPKKPNGKRPKRQKKFGRTSASSTRLIWCNGLNASLRSLSGSRTRSASCHPKSVHSIRSGANGRYRRRCP